MRNFLAGVISLGTFVGDVRFGKNDRVLGQAQFLGNRPDRNAVNAEPLERLPGCWREVGLHDGQELFNDILVMVPVPLAGEVAVRFG